MLLVRDVLDKPLLDRQGRRCGSVDGVVLVVGDSPGERAEVLAIEQGAVTLARRIGERVGSWVRAAAERFGPRHGEPMRITIAQVRAVGREVVVDVDAELEALLAGERWAREHVIDRIPGG